MCHTHGVMNQYNGISPKGPRWDLDTKTNELLWASVPVTGQKKHAHQWCLTGTRSKIIWKRAVRRSDISHRKPGPHGISNWMLPPWERTQTSTRETYDAPRNEQAHTPHTGGFHPSLHPFSISFISIMCRQGPCITNRDTDIDTH